MAYTQKKHVTSRNMKTLKSMLKCGFQELTKI